jgi:hypothetical protein
MRRLSASFDSITPLFEVTRPSTTILPLGTKRSGSNPPARSLSYSMKTLASKAWPFLATPSK